MFRSLLTALTICLGFGAGSIHADTTESGMTQVINVNLTAAEGPNQNVGVDGTAFSTAFAPLSYEGDRWNDISVTSSATGPTGANLLDSEGGVTGIGFSITTNANGEPDFGFSQSISAANSDILANYWAPNTGFGAPTSPPASPVTLTFTGLDDSLFYDFSFLAVGDSLGQGATVSIGSQFAISTGEPSTGSTDAPLEAGENFNTIIGVTSTGGVLQVDLSPAPDGDQNFIALNGFQLSAIVAVPEPSSITLLAMGGLSLFAVRRKKK